jgi:hypothetical protein
MSEPLVIEVCEREMDYHWGYVTGDDGKAKYVKLPKYHAQVKDHPEYGWSAGVTRDEAIGCLIRNHPEKWGINIDYLGKLFR